MQQNERQAVSRELGEDLAELLAAIRIDLAILLRRLEDPGEPVTELLNSIEKLTGDAVAATRRLTNTVLPDMLNRGELPTLINQMCEIFTLRSGVPHYFESSNDVTATNAELVARIYGLVHEALAELGRQQHVSRVFVTLSGDDGSIRLLVHGVRTKLPESIARNQSELSIAAMRDRFAQAGSMLRLSEAPDGSIQFEAALPLNSRSNSPRGQC